jgi:hypothetical protein
VKVETITYFNQKFKKIKRKYHLAEEFLEDIVERLKSGERLGDKMPSIGYDAYKFRVANPSSQRGKSGGFRLIYYLRVADHIYLLTIYAKSEQENVSSEVIRSLIAEILENEPPSE